MNPVEPEYYKANGFHTIEIIEQFGLGFCLGNAVKYILRAGKKDERKQDLKKAMWYLMREIGKEGENE